MDKYVILLPVHYNDGSLVPAPDIDAVIDEFYRLSGGYTLEGFVKGAYRMKSGRKQEDELLRVSVAVPPELEDDLRAIVRRVCRQFRQECIWFEKSNSVIELVESDPAQGDAHE